MEVFGFFQGSLSQKPEQFATPQPSDSQTASTKPSHPRSDRSKDSMPLSEDIDEMVHNPVFWMMP